MCDLLTMSAKEGPLYVHRRPPSETGELLVQNNVFLEEVAVDRNDGARRFGSASDCAAICRICHDGESQERLISPCECSGTMGLIHRSCIETWLGMARTSGCELCGYQLSIRTEPKNFVQWLRDTSSPQDRKNIIADVICFMMLTPLAGVSCWLCISGAMHYYDTDQGHSRWEAVSLEIVSAFLLFIYLLWCGIAVRYQYRVWQEWRMANQNVFLELSHAASNSGSTSPNCDANNNNVNANMTTLSPREEDDSPMNEQYQCNNTKYLSSPPRFARLPNQPVHICCCGHVLHGTHFAADANICEINLLRGLCVCNSSPLSQGRICQSSDHGPPERTCHMNSSGSRTNSDVFQVNDPVGSDPWKGEASVRCEVLSAGIRQWIFNSQSSSDTSPNRNVSFHLPLEEERTGILCSARSSTPTKDGNQQTKFKTRKVRCSLSERRHSSGNSASSCTEALLKEQTEYV